MRFLEYVPNEDLYKTHVTLQFDYLTKIIFGERCPCDMKHLISCINKQVYNGKIELYQINNHFQEERYNDK